METGPNQNTELEYICSVLLQGKAHSSPELCGFDPSRARSCHLTNIVLAKHFSLWLLHQYERRSRNSICYLIPSQGQHNTFLGHSKQLKQKKRLESLILFFISTVQFHSLPPDIDGFNEKINQADGVPALQWKRQHVRSTRTLVMRLF